ncbi:hypothetical protein EDL99_09495, partial [Ornithobacterium rhinotracheale]|uniref:hypothetical protein n=1 Tax=Ornithobacterium rhinotracheale TaxID=28251 RepID=UPI001C86F856
AKCVIKKPSIVRAFVYLCCVCIRLKNVHFVLKKCTFRFADYTIKDDETLNIILAKALFLQNDEKISDEELKKQLTNT